MHETTERLYAAYDAIAADEGRVAADGALVALAKREGVC